MASKIVRTIQNLDKVVPIAYGWDYFGQFLNSRAFEFQIPFEIWTIGKPISFQIRMRMFWIVSKII